MFDSDTQGFYKSEQQESSIMRRSFNPHALQRRAPLLHVGAVYHHEFQSTRPMWGATFLGIQKSTATVVSIHAPHVGRDFSWNPKKHRYRSFNPRAPCGARCTRPLTHGAFRVVSIHAPHAGRDFGGLMTVPLCALFQSTRPVWGATYDKLYAACVFTVSIHAPRVGRDGTYDPHY